MLIQRLISAFLALSLSLSCACNTEPPIEMLPALPSYAHPANGPPPGPSNPSGTSVLSSIEEDQAPTTDEVEEQVYLELWQQVLANTTEPRDEGDEALVYSKVTQSDSPLTLRKHLQNLGILEVHGNHHTLFSALQAAVDKQSWPFIPHIRGTHLVQSEEFARRPDILIGCILHSYALDQRKATLKLLTMRGVVTIRTLSEGSVGNIGIDPNIKYALNCVARGGPKKIVRKASFARRKGNGSNASQFLVFGLQFGSMKKMGFIFCKDPEEPRSGPVGHIMLTYPPSMMDDALSREGSSNKSKDSESSNGSATSDFVQGPATAKPACCPYCSNGYASMDSLRLHLQRSLKDIDDKHPKEEISDFIRNSRKHISQSSPVH